MSLEIPEIIPGDWNRVRLAFQKLKSLRLGQNSIPTFAGLILTGFTASRLVATDANKKLVSSNLVSWVTQTANQVLIADDGDGTITFSTPQDIHTGASPTFAGLTLVNAITEFSTDGTMAGNSDSAVPTEAAIVTYTGALGGTYQPLDADLTSIAALGSAANKMLYTTAGHTWTEAAITIAGRAILDDADASVQRTTLGLGTGDSPTFAGLTLTGNLDMGANQIDLADLGDELVTNEEGSWDFGDNWVWGPPATFVGNSPKDGTLSQTIVLGSGHTYQLTYTVTMAGSDVQVYPRVGGQNGTVRTSSGTYTQNFASITGDDLVFFASDSVGGFTLQIANDVSLKEVLTVTVAPEGVTSVYGTFKNLYTKAILQTPGEVGLVFVSGTDLYMGGDSGAAFRPAGTKYLGTSTYKWSRGYIGKLYLSANSVASPTITMTGHTSGLYEISEGYWGFAVSGVVKLKFSQYGIEEVDGSGTYPSYTFISDYKMGMYKAGTNELGFAVNSTQRLKLTTAGANVIGTLDVTGHIDPTTFETTNGGFLNSDIMASAADTSVASSDSIVKYATLDANGVIMHDAQGGFNNCDVNGTKTKVYTKYFTGTLDADALTEVAHGITGVDNILHVSCAVWNAASVYLVNDFQGAVTGNYRFDLNYDGTNVRIANVGSTVQGQKYRIKIDYVL